MNRAPRFLAIGALESQAQDPIANLAAWAVSLTRVGVDAVQIRDRSAPDRLVHEAVGSVVEALAAGRKSAGEPGADEGSGNAPYVLVNRRADIAAAAGASGVHLPAHGLPTRIVREAFGDAFVIGRSTHSVEEVAEAHRQGADYVVLGPVFATPEKLRFGSPLGVEQLARAAAVGIPVLAIGGINEERLEAVARAGACGVAAIRAFADPVRASELVRRATNLFDRIGVTAHV